MEFVVAPSGGILPFFLYNQRLLFDRVDVKKLAPDKDCLSKAFALTSRFICRSFRRVPPPDSLPRTLLPQTGCHNKQRRIYLTTLTYNHFLQSYNKRAD